MPKQLRKSWSRARLMLLCLESRTVPAVLNVTDAGDSGGPNQLRAMWETARTNGQDDTITFAAGVISINLVSALPTYDEAKNLTLNGNGKTVTTINAGANARIIELNVPSAQPTITISNIQLKGGNVATSGGAILDDNETLVLTNVSFSQNTALMGGAVATNAATATLTVTGCDFTFNTATGTATGSFEGGGGIHFNAAATVTVNSCMFDGNRSGTGGSSIASESALLLFNSDSTTFKNGVSTGGSTSGSRSSGAIFIGGPSTVTIDHATVTGNVTDHRGGMLYAFDAGAIVTIKNSTISKNTSGSHGGVIYALAGSTITLSNDTISNNTAATIGGAIKTAGTLIVTGSTFTGNTAAGIGGGGALYCANAYPTTVTSCTFTNNTAQGLGGAIRGGNAANLTIASSTFTGNTSSSAGGAVYGFTSATVTLSSFTSNTSDTNGGAIGFGSSGTLTFDKSTFVANSAQSIGGAVYANASVNSTLSVFTNNRAGNSTGALRVTSNSTVSFCDFSLNTAGTTTGGAITSGTGTLLISNCTFRNNTCVSTGGAIFSNLATVTINQCTFNKNTAFGASGGGAISFANNPVTINNSTIYDNTASGAGSGAGVVRTGSGALIINSTIIAGNKRTGTGTKGIDISSNSAVTIAGNNSLIGTDTNSSITFNPTVQKGTDTAKLDPLLNALADNGGFLLPDGNKIKTMLPQTLSPAIDTGNNTPGYTFDQRDTGFARLHGPATDVGAVEGISPTPAGKLINLTDVPAVGSSTYSFQVQYTDDNALNSATFENDDVTITGPGFTSQNATAKSVAGGGNSYTVTYTIPAPTGGWGNLNPSNGYNLGAYTVSINASEVADLDGTVRFVPAGSIGTFKTGFATSMVVDKSGDVNDGNFSPGNLTFREAIAVTNQNIATAVDSISFSTTTLGASPTITLGSGTISITDSVVITGPAAKVTIDGNKASGVNQLSFTGKSLTISNGSLTNFSAATAGGALSLGAGTTTTLTNTAYTGNSVSSTGGGAIAVAGNAKLTVSKNTFTNNTATGSSSTNGGAIYISGNSTTISVDSSTFSGNSAQGSGGAIGAATVGAGGTDATINNSIFSGNKAQAGGGAVYLVASGLNTTTNIFSNNTAGSFGGAIRAASSSNLIILDSYFTGNSASQSGGALYAQGGNFFIYGSTFSKNTSNNAGGAISASGTMFTTAEIRNSTFSANTAKAGGGAMQLNTSGATVFVSHSTIADNMVTDMVAQGGGIYRLSAALNISNTILSGNKLAAGAPDAQGPDIRAADSTTINTTAISVNNGYVTGGGSGNLEAYVVTLGALQDNGGFVLPDSSKIPTRMPDPASATIDAGDATTGWSFDQRGAGFNRLSGSKVDMGAVEKQGATLPPVVTGITFGDGTNQRSLVKRIVITFSESVNFMGGVASAFTVTRTGTGGSPSNVTLSATPASGPASSVTITFSGALTEFGSLIDGFYDFKADAAQISGAGGALDGNFDTVPGGVYWIIGTLGNKWFRYFGDSDGDGSLTQDPDFISFRNAFGPPSTIFDFDNDGSVDQDDFIKFRNNFGGGP